MQCLILTFLEKKMIISFRSNVNSTKWRGENREHTLTTKSTKLTKKYRKRNKSQRMTADAAIMR